MTFKVLTTEMLSASHMVAALSNIVHNVCKYIEPCSSFIILMSNIARVIVLL